VNLDRYLSYTHLEIAASVLIGLASALANLPLALFRRRVNWDLNFACAQIGRALERRKQEKDKDAG